MNVNVAGMGHLHHGISTLTGRLRYDFESNTQGRVQETPND